jgi:histidyl-tRNA synthetase
MREVIEAAPRLLDDLDEESLGHFEELQRLLRHCGVEFRINTRLVRGLDYYNRTVFEWVTNRLGAQGTVCAGGRYDGLIAQIGGKSAPGAGFAMGVERLLSLLAEAGARPPAGGPDVYLAWSGASAEAHAWSVAERLRAAGVAVVLHCGGGSFKSQMKKADGSGARFAVIVGEDEAAAGQASLKPLRELSEQVRVGIDELVPLIMQLRKV